MELYDAIDKRRTTREFLDKEVDFEAIRRILEAGNKAPTWNHNRTWSYIVLRTDEEKEYAFEYAKKIAEKFDAEKYLNTWRPYPTTLAGKFEPARGLQEDDPRLYSGKVSAACAAV